MFIDDRRHRIRGHMTNFKYQRNQVWLLAMAMLMAYGCAAGRVAARRSPLSWAQRSPNSHMKVFFMPTVMTVAEIVYWPLALPYYSLRGAFGNLPQEPRKAWFEEKEN